jgi:hypothetical protein
MSEYAKLPNAYVKENFLNNQEIRSAVDPSYCLTVGSGYDNSMSKCDNTPSQQFTYVPSTKQIKSVQNGNCLDVEGNKKNSGTKIGTYKCAPSGFVNQRWVYDDKNRIKQDVTTENAYLDMSLPIGNTPSKIFKTVYPSPSLPTPSQVWYPSNDCILIPSESLYSPCSATQCGEEGKRSRNKYTIVTPSTGLGSCPQEGDMEEISCSAPACPVDCTYTPSDSKFGPCSATQCGKSGTQERLKYTITSPSSYGGSCSQQGDIEKIPCSAPACLVPPTPSPSTVESSTTSYKTWLIVGGVVFLLLIIIGAIMMLRK